MRVAQCCCGSLKVEVDGEPAVVSLCNCIECQRRTGSPFGVGAYYEAAQVRTSGDSKVYQREVEGRGCAFTFAPIAAPPFSGKPQTTRGDTASRSVRSQIRTSQSPRARCSSAAGTTGCRLLKIFRDSLRAATARLAAEFFACRARERIDTLVLRMAGMTLHPAPADLMPG